MSCAKSAPELERALAQLPGVVAARVNYASERAAVNYDPARTSAARLAAVVCAAGCAVPLEQVTYSLSALRQARIVRAAIVRARFNWRTRRAEIECLANSHGAATERLPIPFLCRLLLSPLAEKLAQKQ